MVDVARSAVVHSIDRDHLKAKFHRELADRPMLLTAVLPKFRHGAEHGHLAGSGQPVSNLMTQTQVVLSHPRDAAEYKTTLESNAEELDRMARMIADMLLLAKADNGLVLPNRETVDLADETCALFDFYEALAADKGLQLFLEGNALVLADRLMLRRAIGNLLSNAVRHATPGSCIFVNLADLPDAVSLSIENTGDLIPPEYLDRVFDRFFRADSARQRSDGTGLGLAIAKSIVTAHGGNIGASSSESLTRFTIMLPRPAKPLFASDV